MDRVEHVLDMLSVRERSVSTLCGFGKELRLPPALESTKSTARFESCLGPLESDWLDPLEEKPFPSLLVVSFESVDLLASLLRGT